MATPRLSPEEKLRRQQARIAKRIAGNASTPVAAVQAQDNDASGSDDGIEVAVVESSTPPKKLSLKERVAVFVKQEKPGKAKRKVKTEDNLLLKSLPTLTSLLLFGSHYLIAEEYKDCTPTREEVSDILSPILRIVARRYKLVGEVSEDTLDVWAMCVALVTYSTRAGMRAMTIKATLQQTEEVQHGDSGYAGGYRQATPIRDIRTNERTSRGDKEVSSSGYDGQELLSDSEVNASGDDGGIRALLDRARQQDFEYRRQRGII